MRREGVSRKEFLSCLLETLEQWYTLFLREGAHRFLAAWRGKGPDLKKAVKVTSFGENIARLERLMWMRREADPGNGKG